MIVSSSQRMSVSRWNAWPSLALRYWIMPKPSKLAW